MNDSSTIAGTNSPKADALFFQLRAAFPGAIIPMSFRLWQLGKADPGEGYKKAVDNRKSSHNNTNFPSPNTCHLK